MDSRIKTNECIICSSKKNHYVFSIEKYRVEECFHCGMMMINPQPTNNELSDIYNKNYFFDDEAHSSFLKSKTANYYLRKLEEYTGNPLKGKLLEIGSGHGDFLIQAASQGLEVTGVEYSQFAVEKINEKLQGKGNVICGDVFCIQQENHFDYIVFSDVLEHVRDPRAFMQQVYRLLKTDGYIFVTVPSLDSFTAKWMKSKWMEFKPEHLWYFSKKTLDQLLYSESFGNLKTISARKNLSFSYVLNHFIKYPVAPYTQFMKFFEKCMPENLQKKDFQITASGTITFAQKKLHHTRKKLSVIMAVLNEEKTLKAAIDGVLKQEIKDLDTELIIVESQSSDNSPKILKQYEGHEQVKIIWQKEARGKGYAIREGFKHASGDYILIQDADDEYDFEDYDSLLEPLMTGEQAFVLGARHGGKAWKMRQFEQQALLSHLLNFGHWFFSFLVNICFGLMLKDPFTMFKVFRRDCLEGIQFECNRFDFDYELLIKLVKKGFRPIEIPVNYRSRSFEDGKKVSMIRDPITWLQIILKLRLEKN
jgi:SAM-dependent methyltransferase